MTTSRRPAANLLVTRGVIQGVQEVDSGSNRNDGTPSPMRLSDRLIAFVIVEWLLAGCAYFVSWDETMRSWEGHQIAEFTALNGEPQTVRAIEGGLLEYKFPLPKVDASCVQYWIVDAKGLMKAFHYDGRCRPI